MPLPASFPRCGSSRLKPKYEIGYQILARKKAICPAWEAIIKIKRPMNKTNAEIAWADTTVMGNGLKPPPVAVAQIQTPLIQSPPQIREKRLHNFVLFEPWARMRNIQLHK